MEIGKIICYTSLCGLFCMSCGDSSDQMVSQTKYDAIVEECNVLKKLHEETLTNNEEKSKLINSVVEELNSLSGRTFDLQMKVEGNTANLTMANQIAEDLQMLKKKLNQSSKGTNTDKNLQKIISNLQATISKREEEINQLRQIIEGKDQQIATMGTRISDLGSKLSNTEKQLLIREGESWLKMGDELLNAASMLPDVKGHGNMKDVKRAKLEIALRAISCYERAEALGVNQAVAKKNKARETYKHYQGS